jgi:hypothetical protein
MFQHVGGRVCTAYVGTATRYAALHVFPPPVSASEVKGGGLFSLYFLFSGHPGFD